jgi:hypothetical protein
MLAGDLKESMTIEACVSRMVGELRYGPPRPRLANSTPVSVEDYGTLTLQLSLEEGELGRDWI